MSKWTTNELHRVCSVLLLKTSKATEMRTEENIVGGCASSSNGGHAPKARLESTHWERNDDEKKGANIDFVQGPKRMITREGGKGGKVASILKKTTTENE